MNRKNAVEWAEEFQSPSGRFFYLDRRDEQACGQGVVAVVSIAFRAILLFRRLHSGRNRGVRPMGFNRLQGDSSI